MENKGNEKESRIIDVPGVDDRIIRNESDEEDKIIINDIPLDAENAVPPKAWENQQKAYEDSWENNKNQELEDEL